MILLPFLRKNELRINEKKSLSTYHFSSCRVTSLSTEINVKKDISMFELIDDEHDCFDFVNEDDLPTYVLNGEVSGIDYTRIESLISYLQEIINVNRWEGTVCITSNFKTATSYDYITNVENELNFANEIQNVIENSINKFSTLH